MKRRSPVAKRKRETDRHRDKNRSKHRGIECERERDGFRSEIGNGN